MVKFLPNLRATVPSEWTQRQRERERKKCENKTTNLVEISKIRGLFSRSTDVHPVIKTLTIVMFFFPMLSEFIFRICSRARKKGCKMDGNGVLGKIKRPTKNRTNSFDILKFKYSLTSFVWGTAYDWFAESINQRVQWGNLWMLCKHITGKKRRFVGKHACNDEHDYSSQKIYEIPPFATNGRMSSIPFQWMCVPFILFRLLCNAMYISLLIAMWI